MEGLRRAVTEGKFDAGFATDGDADRIGAIDRTGDFIDSHKIFSILLKHLTEDLGLRGEVVKTFSTTQMIDKLALKHRLRLHLTPIGFKYICELMLTHDILIGGEESGGIGIKGHLPERDGILNSLLLAEVMAQKKKTLGELVGDLSKEFGPHFYGRVDLEVELARAQVLVKAGGRGEIHRSGWPQGYLGARLGWRQDAVRRFRVVAGARLRDRKSLTALLGSSLSRTSQSPACGNDKHRDV